MKTRFLLAVITSCIMMACIKTPKSTNPLEELAWLKAKKTEMSQNCSCIPSIWQATYEGDTIYETGCSGPACDCVHTFYDADGKTVTGSENINIVEFHSKLQNRKLLWACE